MLTNSQKPNISNEMYHKYDTVISNLLGKIMSDSRNDKVIRLFEFDRKDKAHLLVLRVAMIARDLLGYPIEVDGSRWDVFCLNWKIRKHFAKVKRYECLDMICELPPEDGFCVPILVYHHKGEDFTLEDIYEAYYEGSCN